MRRIPPLKSLGATRLTAVVFGIVLAAFVGRFVWDDIASAEDIPRGVVVEGIAIGNTDRATAAARLAQLSPDREITLTFAGDSRTESLGEWGVVLDVEATLDAAADTRGGFPGRIFRWTAAVISDRTVAPVWTVDRDRLESHFGPDAFDLAFETSAIELVDGEFVAVEPASIPIADVDALEAALLAAVDDADVTAIEVPISGVQEVVGDQTLADAANRLTSGSVEVRLAGQLETRSIGSPTLREWLHVGGVVDEAGLTFDPDRVQTTLAQIYPTVGVDGVDGVEFVVGFDAELYLLGALPGTECCAADSAERLMDAIRAGTDEIVTIFPIEDTEAEGLAWAEELGIRELVGEFTTFYTANQTRNINIARIAELTRGAIIEPGETFSVNDFVGPRTTDNGFVSAGVISNGVFSSSVGGGISQYATTLFNAAFFAGLDFGEYQSHSIYIDRYPYGREATVSFPAPDLQIVNTTPYGVLIWPTTDADSITVRLYSTKTIEAEQTGQTERTEGTSCTRVTTERTRTWIESGRTEVDTVTARYRPEGIGCDGSSTIPTTTPPTTVTSTTIPTTVP
ncbi:MAG: VanW family protein [Acidimicrobiales bacterium]